MDFLDPKKQRRHTVLLYAGYALIGVAILISTLVLVYQANGFGVNAKGQVVQNGLLFFSSQPNPSDIYLNGKKNDKQTNTRISLPAARYSLVLKRDGYRDWKRTISVQGGDVQHFDYPFLFPVTLNTKSQANYNTLPGMSSQSRDRRWLLVQQTPTVAQFDVYDLKNDTVPVTTLQIPTSLVKVTGANQVWKAVQWADDNVHLLLKHTSDTSTEYVLLNREDPTKTLNLTQLLGGNPPDLALIDNKYDQYHLFDPATGVLSTASINKPTPVAILDKVLAYKSYGTKTVLYVTSQDAAEGKALVKILVGEQTYPIRSVAANTSYVLDMAGYRGNDYIVFAAASENMVYIYQDPIGQLKKDSVSLPTAIRAIRVVNPTRVSFSPTAQYVAAESGKNFGVYDIYLKRAYLYTMPYELDAPQEYATWMDGNRLTYVTTGKLLVFDFDHRNQQLLMSATAGAAPYFNPDYHYVYSVTRTQNNAQAQLTQTPLLTSADL